MCIIEGCDKSSRRPRTLRQALHAAAAQRRSHATPRKAGGPTDDDPDEDRAYVDRLLPLARRRTRDRLLSALRMMEEVDIDSMMIGEVIRRATRPNGSINVTALEREAMDLADLWDAIFK